MSNFMKAAIALIAISSLSAFAASSADRQQDEAATGITRSSTGIGIPNGSSADKDFLPWLKPTVDPTYGYSAEKPIEIGGFLEGKGNAWPSQYFSSLLGPNGEPTTFERVKSCCAFPVTNPKIIEAGIKVGFLDQFKVTIEGQAPVYIFVTLYTEGEISAPKGFTVRSKGV